MKQHAKRTKFPRKPRHSFDYKALLEIHQSVTSLLRLQVVNGQDANGSVLFSEANVTIVLPKSSPATGGTQRFKVTETFDEFETLADYFAALQWSDSANDFTGDTVYIAKHFKHRPSLTAETLRGTPITYTYASNLDRTSSDGANTQQEELFPPIQVNDEIFCSKLLTPDSSITVVEDSSHPEWVDITPRLWARKITQS